MALTKKSKTSRNYRYLNAFINRVLGDRHSSATSSQKKRTSTRTVKKISLRKKQLTRKRNNYNRGGG